MAASQAAPPGYLSFIRQLPRISGRVLTTITHRPALRYFLGPAEALEGFPLEASPPNHCVSERSHGPGLQSATPMSASASP